MIRIAILEHEKETKDIVFLLSKMFENTDWTFRHFFKASELAKACKQMTFHMFIFDGMFQTPRFESVFVHDNPNALFMYVCDSQQAGDQRGRILHISKENLEEDLKKYQETVVSLCQQVDLYNLNYDGVNVNLPYEDIYYMEKIDKMVYFHTRKGTFHQRMNMSSLEEAFAGYGFIRVHVSYLVNEKHITAWYNDSVQVNDEEVIPMSRAQKRKLNARRKQVFPK